ncbi:hypothetical protein HHK36_032341 [Tetracentron sinense]|uniref:Homeobox domain-containing protein n=1 Tax=Tetracentron sinense TaxID=13715 RepID=A0A834Y7E7_TETSI|nr:hypothetical protein HHK36_032341 [Tetracentron sinense]
MSERFDSGCLNRATRSLENSLLEINNFRPESHVAQQSRREKLRVQQSSTPVNNIGNFPNHVEQLLIDSGLNPDHIQVRNIRNCDLLYDPTMFSSEMLNFPISTHVLLANKDALVHQGLGADRSGRPVGTEVALFANSSHPVSSNFNPSMKAMNPQNGSYWKGVGSQQSSDWIANYVNGSASNGGNQSSPFLGGILSGPLKVNNTSASILYLKPGDNGYEDVQSTLTNPSSEISSQDSQKQYGEMQFNSSSFYQNTVQEVGTCSTIGSQGLEMASLVQQNNGETGHGSWVDGEGERVLPTYGNQSNASQSHLNNAAPWMRRPVESSHQWSGELGFPTNKCEGNLRTVASDSRAQGSLSLSLSSHLPSEIQISQFGESFGSENFQSRTGIVNDPQDSKSNKSGYVCSNSKSFIGNKDYGNSIPGIVESSSYARQSTGPLGPFTGYATILKSSKFLKPAQQLLDEFCRVSCPKVVKTCEMPERGSDDVSILDDATNAENGAGGKGGTSVVSSTLYSSNETSVEGGVGIGSCESYQPEYQLKKAKLLYMHEEVCRRYKQYHQQMQMVVSSFESVAGLSAATPYTSMALKTVSRHFRCLKNAISDQLRHISKALGEDLSSPTTGTSSSKEDMITPRLKFLDQSLRKHKFGGDNLGFLEPQQHVWRPQRGLPERSVSILRAWLFEHFLHPYPTDTDKHMLATQTGLSRNQVSNWFINARVRVWKPMVEEIHMLETKGSAETDQNSGKNDGKPTTEGASRLTSDQPSNKLNMDPMPDNRLESLGIGSMANADGQSAEHWNQGKRTRVESQISTSMNGSLMGFVPYNRSGLEIGGLEAVSLTLGLRHSTENAQQQQQQLEQEHQLRRHFGGQMIHDFVG